MNYKRNYLLDARRHTLQAENAKDQEQLKSWEAQFSDKQREEERINGTVTLLEEQLRTTKREVEDTSLRISEAEASKKGEEQQLLILDRLIEDENGSIRI